MKTPQLNEEPTLRRSRNHHSDRITLEPKSIELVDRWMTHLMDTSKGVHLTRRDFVNWLIQSRPEILTAKEVNELRSRFYDEVRCLEEILKEARRARANGEPIAIERTSLDLPSKGSSPKRRLKVARKKPAEIESPPQNEISSDSAPTSSPE